MFKALKKIFSGNNSSAPSEAAEISSAENLFPHMLSEPSSVRSQSMDEDENTTPPKDAEISYLDAKALKFWNKKRTDFDVPGYYADSAFGRNVRPALRRLLNGGYLDLAGIERSINLKTVPELKTILSEHGLKPSGKKAELVNRLMSNLSNQELEFLFPTRVYEITPKGEHALEAYSIIFTNEKMGVGLPYYRLIKEKEMTPSEDDTSIILRILLQDMVYAQKEKNQESYRVKSMETARVLRDLGKVEESIQYYCLSFFMSWYRNTFEFQINNISAYEYDAKRIDECGKLCGYSLDRTLDVFQKSLLKHNPFGLCTPRNVSAAQQTFRRALSV